MTTDSGSGVNVYVIDTGILYTHIDFGGRAYSFWSYDGGVSKALFLKRQHILLLVTYKLE